MYIDSFIYDKSLACVLSNQNVLPFIILTHTQTNNQIIIIIITITSATEIFSVQGRGRVMWFYKKKNFIVTSWKS